MRDRHRVVAEVGHDQIAQQQAAVGVRIGAHSPRADRCECLKFRDQPAGRVEQLLGTVAAHPLLELRAVLGVGVGVGQWDLVGAPRPLDGQPVDDLGSGPSLGGTQHDHRPGRPFGVRACAGVVLDAGDVVEHRVKGCGELLVHGGRVVAADEVGFVAVAAHQFGQLGLGDARQHGGVGDLVAVEVQDRQHGAVPGRVEELVGVPAGGERPGFGFSVADHAQREQVGVVEHGAVGVDEGIAEFAAFVDRAGRLRVRRGWGYRRGRRTAGTALACRPRPGRSRSTPRCRCRRGRRSRPARAAVTGTGHVQHVEISLLDHAVHVRVQQVQPRGGAPVPEQARLDVLGQQGLTQQRVVEQVDLPDGQVVRGPPVGVQQRHLLRVIAR